MGSSKSKPQTQNKQPQTQSNSNNSDKKPHIVTKTKEQTKSIQQPIISDKQINSIVDSVTQASAPRSSILIEDYFLTLQDQLKNNQIIAQLQQQRSQITNSYLKPIVKCYEQIPQSLTTLKFTYLNCFNYNDRLTALGLASMIVGIASFRTAKAYQLPVRAFGALKDATISYFIGGLVIAPQIFNPIIMKN